MVIDRSNRAVLTVTGPDRLTWLHTLTSQFLTSLADGEATQALVLSPQGHVEHHLVVTELAGTTYLDTEPGAGAGLLGYLDGMRFWSKVEVADASPEFALLSLIGPQAWTVAADGAAGRRSGRGPGHPAGRSAGPVAADSSGAPTRGSTCWSPAPHWRRPRRALIARRRGARRQLGGRRTAHPDPPPAVGGRHRRPHDPQRGASG